MFVRVLAALLLTILGAAGAAGASVTAADPVPRWQWSEHGRLTRQARELSDALTAAGDQGLNPGDYSASEVAAEIRRLSDGAPASDEDWRRFDGLLSRSALQLSMHLHAGRIDPRRAGFELKESRPPLEATATLAALAASARVADTLASFEPQFFHYRLLKTALARYRSLALDPTMTGLTPIGRKSLHPGDAYASAPALRKLLTALGDLPTAGNVAPADEQRLDEALVEALRRFQIRHGLAAEGALGAQTYAALTVPLAARVRQIELTLERWRWLPAFQTPPIIVNIPQFKLFAFRTVADRAADIMQMDVIVGQTYERTQTPVFVGDMKYVIFRPYWDVPRGITLREMLPELRSHPDYLQRNNLEIVDGESDTSAVISPSAEAIAAVAAGRYRLRQRPGDDNALGLIKFIFPNEHNVYMHSTPAHRLFLQNRRAFSHGCIRVSDPTGLAAFVLRNAADSWEPARIQAAMQGPDSARVPLRNPIRVMILYATAQATEAGPIQFFEDIYGHDRRLERLLGLAPVHGTNGRH